jgi:hypothetical protein
MPRMDTFPAPYLFMLVPFLIWLGVVVLIVMFALRLVRGIERIANALERRP